MSACPCCGFDPAVEAPIFDEYARRVLEYFRTPGVPIPATTRELHANLGIPYGSLLNKWFRGRARDHGVESRTCKRVIVWELA